MNIYLTRHIKYDESSTITLKYFLRYSFSVVDLKISNWCIILWCKSDSYEGVFSCLSG